jgi:ribosomal protein L37AE/L43A
VAVTKLEQWKNDRKNRPEPIVVAEKTHVAEIECAHCHRHFFRWISTASAYWRCEDCMQTADLVRS